MLHNLLMLRTADGLEKYYFLHKCFYLCLSHLWVRWQPLFNSVFRAGSVGITHCWCCWMLGGTQRVCSNGQNLLLQIKTLIKETILPLGAECPALSATCEAHVSSTLDPHHILSSFIWDAHFPVLPTAPLDSSVLNYIQFYFLPYEVHVIFLLFWIKL